MLPTQCSIELETAVRNELRTGEKIKYLGTPDPMRCARRGLPICLFGLFFGGFALFWMAGAGAATWFSSGKSAREEARIQEQAERDAIVDSAMSAHSSPRSAVDPGGAAGTLDPAANPNPSATDGSKPARRRSGNSSSSSSSAIDGVFDFFPLFGLPFFFAGLGMFSAPLWMMRRAKRTACCVTDQRAMLLTAGRSINVKSWSPEELGEVSKETFSNGTGSVCFFESSSGRSGSLKPDGFIGVQNPREAEDALNALKAKVGEEE